MEKRSVKTVKWITGIMLLLMIVTSAIVVFSPYGKKEGFEFKLISHSIEINAPTETVFNFLGNSKNASRWSVYVDHIIPLNSDQFKDGVPGSVRRCFRYADKSGTQWDELITEVIPNKKRQLTIFNMKDFPMKAEGLATEQWYQDLENQKTQVTFTVFFINRQPTMFDALKTYLAAYQIKRVFAENMENIKAIVEKEERSSSFTGNRLANPSVNG
jgi:uncharacterized protein YndB with AHSA1/START domain